jgi:restriction system protein
MRPSLAALADGETHTQQQIRDFVAQALDVSAEERQILLDSGKQPVFSNRVGWAMTYLKHAGLVERVKHNAYRITDLGQQALSDNPDSLNLKVLGQYPGFQEFVTNSSSKKAAVAPQAAAVVAPVEEAEDQTPNEAIAAIVADVEASLAADLLDRVYAKPPEFLEHLALRLLRAMGYGGRQALLDHTGGSGDKGLDGVIRQDALGLDRIGVQAKRYDPNGTAVPGKEVQAFAGALDEVAASRGVFVTTAAFSKPALNYAERASKRLVLIDGTELTRLMIRYGVGVEEQQRFSLLEVDEDFFGD